MSMRAKLIRTVTFLGGLYFFLKFVLPEQVGFASYHEQISNGFVLVGSMALALGLINLLMVHGSRVLYLRRDWQPSVALLVGLGAMLVVTSLDWRGTSQISEQVREITTLQAFATRIVQDAGAGVVVRVGDRELSPEDRNVYLTQATEKLLKQLEPEVANVQEQVSAHGDVTAQRLFERSKSEFDTARSLVAERVQALDRTVGEFSPDPNQQLAAALSQLGVGYRGILQARYGTSVTKRLYDFLFEGLFISLGAAMFSLLGFYICAAAYRAFRLRSMESLLMMTAALLVMLGQIPFGLWISDSLPEIRLWLLQVPSAAAARAIEMGASLAGLVMAFRMWLSIETESFK